MKTVPLFELCDINIGRTPSRAESAYWGPGHRWLSIADMNQGLMLGETKEQITDAGARVCVLVQPGTVLLSFKLSIGKVGIAEVPLYTNEAIAALPVKDARVLDARYLMRALQSMNLAGTSNRAAMGATLNKKSLAQVRIPLPSLSEQHRIVVILDHADALRAKRRQVLAHLDALAQSIFHDRFGAGADVWTSLGDLADITSGITKGRRTMEPTLPTPYLAVANVQAGYLKLDTVKEIDATAGERDRYALQNGDLVLTEGGDPDKLGRGTVWRDELPLCLHQNHIFRVRVRPGRKVDPFYLVAFMAGRAARAYFLRSAKQTTGIASINMAQLKALSVPVPPWSDQMAYVARVTRIKEQQALVRLAVAADDELFASLQSRAFRGEL